MAQLLKVILLVFKLILLFYNPFLSQIYKEIKKLDVIFADIYHLTFNQQ